MFKLSYLPGNIQLGWRDLGGRTAAWGNTVAFRPVFFVLLSSCFALGSLTMEMSWHLGSGVVHIVSLAPVHFVPCREELYYGR
jgi:hypothetical protein